MQHNRIVPSIFEREYPSDSGPSAFFNRKYKIWFDCDGIPLIDLTEFGFSARMRETIMMYIHKHEEDGYVGVINDYGDSIELFW